MTFLNLSYQTQLRYRILLGDAKAFPSPVLYKLQQLSKLLDSSPDARWQPISMHWTVIGEAQQVTVAWARGYEMNPFIFTPSMVELPKVRAAALDSTSTCISIICILSNLTVWGRCFVVVDVVLTCKPHLGSWSSWMQLAINSSLGQCWRVIDRPPQSSIKLSGAPEANERVSVQTISPSLPSPFIFFFPLALALLKPLHIIEMIPVTSYLASFP